MNFGYVIENLTGEYIDNAELFQLIRTLDIAEDEIYIDERGHTDSLLELLERLDRGDRLVLLTISDLSDTAKGLLLVTEELQDRGVILCSVHEAFLNGEDYFTGLKGFLSINRYYIEKSRQVGYSKAVENKRVGRPQLDSDSVDKAIRLYQTKSFKIDEIEAMTGVSKSTLFRKLKEKC